MAMLLKGAAVVSALNEQISADTAALRSRGVVRRWRSFALASARTIWPMNAA
jgi:hypothetical protein